jgi:phosphoglycerol transferase MdoB-like AlkP superfamily enzyme
VIWHEIVATFMTDNPSHSPGISPTPRFSLLLFGALSILWATESYFVQSVFLPSAPTGHPLFFASVRFSLDLLVSVALVLVCRRRILILLYVVGLLANLVLLAYNSYFHHVFSLYYGLKAVDGQTLGMGSGGLALLSPYVVVALCIVFACKVALTVRLRIDALRFRWRAAFGCVLAACGLIGGMQWTHFSFSRIPTNGLTHVVYCYGYLTSWAAEWVVAPAPAELAEEVAALQKKSEDRLSAVEPAWIWGNKVVVIQVESLDWAVLDYRNDGRAVTPYLNNLARHSRLFKVKASHAIGSLDMDYAVLSGGAPSSRIITYQIPNIPYENALPRFLQRRGFHTVSFHGNNGDFFNRRANFDRMGFDEIWFSEEFDNKPVDRSSWGVRDVELFRLSSRKMRESTRPEFHFIITMDSHVPWNLIRDSEKELFPGSRNSEENYLNSIRLVDHNLRDYIESLPKGTLVILYGDHSSGVEYKDFHSAHSEKGEFVPCVIHVCGDINDALAAWNAVAPELPEDLRIMDVMNCFRHQLSGRFPVVDPEK